jgi:Flp pilus assembly protein TadG
MADLRARRRHRAVVAIEAALVLPILLVLVLGVVEYGWLILKSQQMTNAVRHGARMGITVDGTYTDVENAVTALMDAAGMGGSGYTLTIAPANVGDMNAGELLTVELSVDYANIGLDMPLLPTPTTLRSSVSMAKEG